LRVLIDAVASARPEFTECIVGEAECIVGGRAI